MDDDVLKTVPDQNYFHRYPALHLLRIFRIALDVRKIVLALAALFLICGGNYLIDQSLLERQDTAINRSASEQGRFGLHSSLRPDTSLFLTTDKPEASMQGINLPQVDQGGLLLPLMMVAKPTFQIVSGENSWEDLAYFWSHLIWALLVWGFFGASLTRLAGEEFVTDTRASLRNAALFSGKNYLSFLLPAFICVCVGLFFWFSSLIVGLVTYIPAVGELLLGIIWFLPLVFSLLMALMLLGAIAGWPLSFATISVEGSDGFDGFSRPYSYLFSRPLRFLLYVAAVTFMSFILFFAFEAFVGFVNSLAVSSAYPQGKNAPLSDWNGVLQFWQHLMGWVVVAFETSFFWTAATVVYFLMRKADDGIALDEIYFPPEQEEDSEAFPLSGVAASSHEPTKSEMPDIPRNKPESPEEKTGEAEE